MKQATLLPEVNRLMASAPNITKGLQRLLTQLEDQLRCDAAMLWIFDPKEVATPAFLSVGLGRETTASDRNKPFPLPVPSELVEANTALVSDDLAKDERFLHREPFLREGLTSAIGLPLIVHGQTQGAMCLFAKGPQAFKRGSVQFLLPIADTVALHLHDARLQSKANKIAAQLETAIKDRVEFTSLLSRELRTPLTVVLGHAAMIHDGMLGQINRMQESGLEAIMRSSRDLLSKVKEGLEQRVVERTAELSKTLKAVQKENVQRRRMERELRRSREQLRELSRRVLSAQEDERRRIAREVHDELGQALTALKIDLTWINQKQWDDLTAVRDRTAGMIELVDRTIREVRRIARELRPAVLDDLGLVAAIEWQAQEFQSRTGVRCRAEIPPHIDIPDPACSTAVFRIFQEALTNVARHAQATEVRIELAMSARALRLQVEDNGRGIKEGTLANPRSFGLIGMRERVLPWGGDVAISSPKGGGTAVMVTIPIRPKRKLAGTKKMGSG